MFAVGRAISALIDPQPENLGIVAQGVSWGAMLLILGSVMGAVAGAFSSRALNSALGGSDI
jgi:hypothetical protein